jgi:hypothetical protein
MGDCDLHTVEIFRQGEIEQGLFGAGAGLGHLHTAPEQLQVGVTVVASAHGRRLAKGSVLMNVMAKLGCHK